MKRNFVLLLVIIATATSCKKHLSRKDVSTQIINAGLEIPYTSKKLKKSIYEVTPTAPLPSGEYCFMFAASSMYAG